MRSESTEPFAPGSVRRRFLGWDSPALERAVPWLAELADQGGSDDAVLDASGLVVVVPAARAGRLLLERLVGWAEEHERALWPPRILSPGGLPELFYAPELPAPDGVLERLVWIDALERTPSEMLPTLLPDPPASGDAAGWDALAATVVRLHRELGAEGLTFERVAERCSEGSGFDDALRWRVLAGVQARALARLRELGWMDRDEARRRGLERLRAGRGPESRDLDGRTLLLLGTVELPGLSRDLIGAWLRARGEAGSGPAVEVLVHAPEDRGDDFDALGGLVKECWSGARLPIADEVIRVVDGPGEQADAVLDELARLGSDASPEEVTVGVPDPNLGPFVMDRLCDAGVSARIASGRPAERTSAYRLIEAVAAWLRSGTFEDLAALFRHPDVERFLAHTDPALGAALPEALDRYQARHLQAVLPEGALPEDSDRDRDRQARSRVQAARDRLRERLMLLLEPGSRTGTRALSAWPERLRAVVLGLLGGRTLDRAVPDDRETLHVSQELAGVLESIEALPRPVDRAVSAGEFLRIVLGQLRDRPVPPPADRGAVELLGWLELHLDDAPVVLLTGVNEPFLPEAITVDPFLPDRLRSRLGIVDNTGRWARDLYRLQAILASGRRVRLISGRRDADGSPVRLSRLLLADDPETIARRIRGALGSSEERESRREDAAADEARPEEDGRAESASPIRLPPEPELSDERERDSMSVTEFARYLRDPYQFGLVTMRGLGALDDEARELDPLGFGNLAHDVLEAWASRPGVDRMDGDELADALNRALDRVARERFGERPLPAVRIQVEQLRARLGAVAEVQAERNREGWRIRAVEARPENPGVAFDVDGREFWLRGRIDRIDQHPDDGRWQLLDYKTSAQAKSPDAVHRKGRGEAKEWVDLQLPLYRRLARGLSLGIGGTVEVGYFLLPSELDRTGVDLADWSETELADADEKAREVVRRVRQGTVYWDPEASRIGTDDALGPVVGAGTMRSGGDR